MSRTILPLTIALMAVLLSSAAAFAAIKVGTDGNDTIIGTKNPDHVTGRTGNDILDGRAGNDVYHFADGFGDDTLIEPKKVGKLPGGADTISFSGVTTNSSILLIPQWRDQGFDRAFINMTTNRVILGASRVEKAAGGSASDSIVTGSGSNTLKGGAGGSDSLRDYGGFKGDSALPTLPASDDTYEGFAAGPGFDSVVDYGGTADVLDVRPWESSDVHIDAFDVDANGQNDALLISDGDRGVYVYRHLAPTAGLGASYSGTMEKIVFADETITSASRVKTLIRASSEVERSAMRSETPAPPSLDAAGDELLGPIPRGTEVPAR